MKAKKSSRGAPLEVSSKKPVAPNRMGKRRVEARDPRFDDFSGQLDMDNFQKHYRFLEDYRASELDDMKKQLSGMEKKRRKKRRATPGADESQLRDELRRRVQQDKQRTRG